MRYRQKVQQKQRKIKRVEGMLKEGENERTE
jgi:hypothetical protein